jgi:vacuolar-type H+-ATPase subunit H
MTIPGPCPKGRRDHSELPFVRGVVVGCLTCRNAGLPPQAFSVRGRGWRCKKCGEARLAPEAWRHHELSEAHRAAERSLARKAALDRDLIESERRLAAVRAELDQVEGLTPSEIARRTAQTRTELMERTREIRDEQGIAQRELNATREKLRAVEAEFERRQGGLASLPPAKLVEKARDEARAIREQAEENAKEIVREAKESALGRYDSDIEAKKRELRELAEKIDKMYEAYEDEQKRIATKREDKALWNMAPAEVKEWFSFIRDTEARTDYAIAVLIVRQEKDKRIAEVMSVPVSRVRDVRAGDGDFKSRLEEVREQMGAPPDGWSPPIDYAIPTAARPGLPAPKPKADDSAIRATAFRRFEDGAHVRDVHRETGKSLGWCSKVYNDWKSQKEAAAAAP